MNNYELNMTLRSQTIRLAYKKIKARPSSATTVRAKVQKMTIATNIESTEQLATKAR